MTKTNLNVYGSFFAISHHESVPNGPIKIGNVAWI